MIEAKSEWLRQLTTRGYTEILHVNTADPRVEVVGPTWTPGADEGAIENREVTVTLRGFAANPADQNAVHVHRIVDTTVPNQPASDNDGRTTIITTRNGVQDSQPIVMTPTYLVDILLGNPNSPTTTVTVRRPANRPPAAGPVARP